MDDMKLDAINRIYFQKSRWFLLPQIGVHKASNIRPDNTYLIWDKYNEYSERLIVTYPVSDTEGFRVFEQTLLLNNPLFEDLHQCENNLNTYIFTFEEQREDYFLFLQGKYSQLSASFKKKIMDHHKGPGINHTEAFLFPERYWGTYSRLLANPSEAPALEDILRKNRELCSPPDLLLETLHLKRVNLENSSTNGIFVEPS